MTNRGLPFEEYMKVERDTRNLLYDSKHHNADSPIVSAQVGIALPFGILLEQLPCDLLGDAPVLARDEGANQAVLHGQAKLFLELDPQFAANAAGAISVDKFDGGASVPPGGRQFILHAQAGGLYPGHIFLKIDDLYARRFAGHGDECKPGKEKGGEI